MRKRVIAIGIASLALSIGGLVAASPAHAYDSPGQLYNPIVNGYINAWNGGPYVNLEKSQALNNDVEVQGPDDAFNVISAVNGECIADYNNEEGSARAALYNCSDGTPWGANFTAASCDNGDGVTLWDNHWSGYLAPASSSNGAAFYLNSGSEYCWEFEAAY